MPLCRVTCKTVHIPPKQGNSGGGILAETCACNNIGQPSWPAPSTAKEGLVLIIGSDRFARAVEHVQAAPGEVLIIREPTGTGASQKLLRELLRRLPATTQWVPPPGFTGPLYPPRGSGCGCSGG